MEESGLYFNYLREKEGMNQKVNWEQKKDDAFDMGIRVYMRDRSKL